MTTQLDVDMKQAPLHKKCVIRRPLYAHCGRQTCCRVGLTAQVVDPSTQKALKMLVPLKNVDIKGRLEDGIAHISAHMFYVNEHSEDSSKPLECSFEFPIEESTVVSKLIATINDKTIEAKIQGKEEAKEKFDDAVAAGNTAVYAERKKQDESLTLLLGNLPSG